jgi:uncharacterized RDD family membrane protein YckC
MTCRNHPDVSEDLRRCSRCGGTFCRDCLVDMQGLPYCAACKSEQLLDVRSGVDRTVRQYAGIGARFGAMFIDGLIVNIPMMGVLIFFAVFAAMSTAKTQSEPPFWINFISIPFMFVSFFYEALMLQYKKGQTLGKMAVKVKVVRVDGSDISSGQAWGRAGMRLVLGCFWIADYIPAFFTQDKTTLHDMVAGTRVVEIY